MYIDFKSTRLEKEFKSQKSLTRRYGPEQAKKIQLRMAELRAAQNLAEIQRTPPARCHQLTGGKRDGLLSVDLAHPYRLLFEPNHSPLPELPGGGLDWSGVTQIRIVSVEDTHG